MAYNDKYAKPSAGSNLMRAAFLLLILVTVSVCMMGGLLAKYNGTGTGSDSARVAKFDVKVTGAQNEKEIVCTAVESGSGTYTVTVKNESEVAVHYDLSLLFTSGDSTGVTWAFSPASGDLAVGETDTSTLTFAVDWNEFTRVSTGSSASVALDFTVTVNVTQID